MIIYCLCDIIINLFASSGNAVMKSKCCFLINGHLVQTASIACEEGTRRKTEGLTKGEERSDK